MIQFEEFRNFVVKWFRGPLSLGEFREVFYSIGDPRGPGMKDRGVFRYNGFRQFLEEMAPHYRDLNLFIGIGFVKPGHVSDDLAPEYLLYDRLVYDFDCEDDPYKGVEAALFFADKVREKYGADSVVYVSGFKGAHVTIPLAKPTDWEGYVLSWKALLTLLPREYKSMVDYNMLQYNRVDRAPYTWNVKDGRRAFVRIITPESMKPWMFSWNMYRPLDLSKIVVYKPVLPEVKPKKIIKAGKPSWRWVLKIVDKGLPDGRKRFILYVLTPYIAINSIPEDQGREIIREFIEASCRNRGACSKIYDSWIKAVLRGAIRKKVKPRSLRIMREKDPELYRIVMDTLRQSSTVIPLDNGLKEYHDTLLEFIHDTGLGEFGYNDLKKWLENRKGKVSARKWHNWERILRLLAEKGLLGRKYLVNGEWIDYGPGKTSKKPPSKTVKFYLVSNPMLFSHDKNPVKGGIHD